jgi:hypothetical protein
VLPESVFSAAVVDVAPQPDSLAVLSEAPHPESLVVVVALVSEAPHPEVGLLFSSTRPALAPHEEDSVAVLELLEPPQPESTFILLED